MSARAHAELTVTLRESRLIVERIMHLNGVAPGVIPYARDCVVISEAMKLGGLEALETQLRTNDWGRCVPIAIEDHRDETILDCQGQHAWLVAHAITDVLIASLRRSGFARAKVVDVAAIEELGTLAALGEPHSATVTSRIEEDDGRRIAIAAAVSGLAGGERTLQCITRQGLSVPAALWWRLYDYSAQALEPDSTMSRRHAGPIIITDDGKIIGRLDEAEDTDSSMLAGGPGLGRPGAGLAASPPLSAGGSPPKRDRPD